MGDASLANEVQNRLAGEAALHGDKLWELPPSNRKAIELEMARHRTQVCAILNEFDARRGAGGGPPAADEAGPAT